MFCFTLFHFGGDAASNKYTFGPAGNLGRKMGQFGGKTVRTVSVTAHIEDLWSFSFSY